MSNNITVRKYKESDAPDLANIYYNTIHTVNTRDYTEEQVNAWAPSDSLQDYSGWQTKLDKIKPFVAEIDSTIVGFAEFEPNGHIDCFYVHNEYQGAGVGSSLIQAIFEMAKQDNINRIYAEVSITAKPFFKAKGFKVVKEQTVNLRGVELKNFVMEKHLLSGFVFEKATRKQAQKLVDFEQTICAPRLYSKPLDLEDAIKEIDKNHYYFIKHDGQIVGTAAYCVREDESCHISNMAVSAQCRGQGIARKAMMFLMEKCQDHWRIDLSTHPENFRSIPLYESFGFITEKTIDNFLGDGEPRMIMAKNNMPAEGLRMISCSTNIERRAAKNYRNKYFFDNVPIDDPYTWTFDHKDHQHFVLYNDTNIIGYAHIQIWPENRAAIRIIVIDKDKRRQGFATWFLKQIEVRLKKSGFSSLHAESSPTALNFYTVLGYTPMPFNDPDGYEGGEDDVAVGKIL